MQQEFTCKICGLVEMGKRFTNHLSKMHDLKSRDYTIKHLYDGKTPACPTCGKEPRYTTLSFKKYCIEHSFLAEREAGRLGGKIKKTWSKGKTAADDERLVLFSKNMSGSKNHFFGKSHSEETKAHISQNKKLSEEEYLRRCLENPSAQYFQVLTPYELYEGQGRPFRSLHVLCKFCSREDDRYLVDLIRGTRCHSCFPIGSLPESEIADFVRSLGVEVIQNTRKVIPPKEIDVWVPERKVGIEFHGLYWHSGGIDRNETYTKTIHSEKRKLMLARDGKLVQFFSDEWRARQDICKSMLRQRLGFIRDVIGARKCTLGPLDPKIGQAHFNATHIDGATRSRAYFGLTDATGVVAAMSFRVPIQKRYGNVIELSRFSTRRDISCPGAASRLMRIGEEYARSAGFVGILSYADLRFGEGKVYEKIGFTKVGETGLSYWYTDGVDRFNRFAYRAQDGMTEKEFAALKMVRPVWGCGNAIYLKMFS